MRVVTPKAPLLNVLEINTDSVPLVHRNNLCDILRATERGAVGKITPEPHVPRGLIILNASRSEGIHKVN